MHERTRSSLESLKRKFEAGSERFGPVDHVLVVAPFGKRDADGQSVFDSELHYPPGWPKDECYMPGPGGQIVPPAWPTAGEWLCWFSLFRGDPGGIERFLMLARDAGALFRDIAASALKGPPGRILGKGEGIGDLFTADAQPLFDAVPRAHSQLYGGGTCFGREAHEHKLAGLFLMAMHELGWAPVAGSPLRIPRIVWSKRAESAEPPPVIDPRTGRPPLWDEMVYVDDAQLARNLETVCGGALVSDRLREETSIPPQRWYSEVMRDPFTPATYAVDRILDVLPRSEPDSAPRRRVNAMRPVVQDAHEKAAKLKERREAVKLAEAIGIRPAARELNLKPSTLSDWCKAEGIRFHPGKRARNAEPRDG